MKTYNPSVLQWHHVVDIYIAGGCPGCTVVRAEPRSRGGRAGGVDDHVGAVTLEDVLTGANR